VASAAPPRGDIGRSAVVRLPRASVRSLTVCTQSGACRFAYARDCGGCRARHRALYREVPLPRTVVLLIELPSERLWRCVVRTSTATRPFGTAAQEQLFHLCQTYHAFVNPTRSRSRSVGRQLFAAHRAKHRHRQFPAVAQAPTAGHLQRQLGGRVKASSHASMPYAIGYTRCLTLTPGLKKAPASTPALPSRPRGHHGQLRPRRWARPGDRRRHL